MFGHNGRFKDHIPGKDPKSLLRQMVAGLGVALIVLGIASCSDLNNPLAPSSPQNSPHSIGADAFVPVSMERDPGLNVQTKPVSITKRISALTGGTVTLSGSLSSGTNTYSYTLLFPPLALAQNTDITISAPDDATIEIDAGPDGTQFTAPVTLTIMTNGTGFTFPQANLDIYVFNPVTGQWDALGASITGTPGADLKAATILQHFSRYSMGGNN